MNIPSFSRPLAAALAAVMIPAVCAKEKEEFHQTAPLKESGDVVVDNVNGFIKIVSWDKNDVQIDAVKQAPTQADLQKITIEVSNDPDKILIKTKYLDKNKNNKGSVDYTIRVPRKVSLQKIGNVNGNVSIEGIDGSMHVSTVNGGINVAGVSKAADISSVNGNVNVQFSKLSGAENVAMKTVNGGIQTKLPKDASAQVRASTVNGSIKSDFDLPVKKGFPLGSNLNGELGKGGPKMKLETVNGSIKIGQS